MLLDSWGRVGVSGGSPSLAARVGLSFNERKVCITQTISPSLYRIWSLGYRWIWVGLT